MTGLVPFGFDKAVKHAENFTKNMPNGIETGLDAAAQVYIDAVQYFAPFKTGQYRNSIKVLAAEKMSRVVGSDAFVTSLSTGTTWNLGSLLEFGTGSHVIEGNPLAWSGGKFGPGMHFAMRVNHPGTDPHPHFEPAIPELLLKFPNILRAEMLKFWSG